MKRFFCIVCVIVLCLAMTACDPGTYNLRQETDPQDVVSVELIQYDNPKQKKFASWVPDHFIKLRPVDLSAVTVLETLEEESKETFLDQLSRERILWKYYVFDSPKGVCIRITYSCGDCLIVSADYENESHRGYIGMYNADGEVTDFYGSFVSYYSFDSLVDDYFETNI